MPKLTRQQSALGKMNLLKMDMLSILDETPERFTTPYNPIAPINESIRMTILEITRYMRQSHRIAVLAHLYYLGELLEVTRNARQTWREYIQKYPLSNHERYYRSATRTYEIFQNNMEQIYRTKYLSMHYIAGMTNGDYRNNFLIFVKGLGSEDFAF